MTRIPEQEKASDDFLDGLLRSVAAELGLALSEAQSGQLAKYFSLLLRWNQKINLTSLRAPEEIAWRHFGESLFVAARMAPPHGTLADIGSGAGFPGLPLKIAWPSVHTLLLEPNGKKAAFLKEVIRTCGLSAVQVRVERLEEQTTQEPFWPAALLTVRAVKISDELLECARRLLAPQGCLALFIGADAAAEVALPAGFAWQAAVRMPRSERRMLLLGTKLSSPQG